MHIAHDDGIRDVIEVTLLPGVGSLTQNRIWQKLSQMSDLFSMDEASLASLGIGAEALSLIRCRAYQATAAEILDWAKREKCRFLTQSDPDYPSLLKEISDPPLLLYARGRLDILAKTCISVVGTRRPTIYGVQMAEGIAEDLSRRGLCIVSGLARGIDAAAHRGALAAGGSTIAVLGCGIDIVYPREHRRLTEKILENGLLLSEFTPGTSPAPQNFPVRNRIISGLALGTAIIEASEYSGSLITARLAMEQNREVFAIPGNLTSPQSFGPNFLIKQGAKLVQTWRDIADELPPDIRQKIFIKEDARPCRTPGLAMLSEEECRLLDLLKTDETLQFDWLCRTSSLAVSRLSDLLLNLEMKGWVRQLPGNLYVKLRK
jgi:DNA processing protein